MLTKIDVVTHPEVKGVPPQVALENIERVLRDTQILLMHVNNAVIDLQREVENIRRSQGRLT